VSVPSRTGGAGAKRAPIWRRNGRVCTRLGAPVLPGPHPRQRSPSGAVILGFAQDALDSGQGELLTGPKVRAGTLGELSGEALDLALGGLAS
jgi:hypothetical protein